jgi:phenylacetate-coenzyme A ligase PaaK-like adenylate-forming protein
MYQQKTPQSASHSPVGTISTGPNRLSQSRRMRRVRRVLSFVARRFTYYSSYVFALALTRSLRVVRNQFPLWLFFARHYHRRFDRLARLFATSMCAIAVYDIPAYRRRSMRNLRRAMGLARFSITDKENYARAFGFAERCRHGRLTGVGILVDESSGSSGIPFNWVRSTSELEDVHANIANYVRLEFPTKRLFTINAFSMGAWATGLNVSKALERVGIVKSVGPDSRVVIDTLRAFGPEYDYLIAAYPPFLKQLCDQMDSEGFEWPLYRIFGLVAGESITEALRSYLERRLLKVRSGYGASDVQIGVAGEFGFTVWLRQHMLTNPELRYALLGDGEDRIPMIFQFSPLDSYIEVSTNSELLITVNSLAVISPKLRYNLGDEGRVLPFDSVVEITREFVPGLEQQLDRFADDLLRLPALFLFGRRDGTISYMGANIYPQDVEYGLYALSDTARLIRNFCLRPNEGTDLDPIPTVHVELHRGVELDKEAANTLAADLQAQIVQHLGSINRDFAKSLMEKPIGTNLCVCLHSAGEGIFTRKSTGIKNQYLAGA